MLFFCDPRVHSSGSDPLHTHGLFISCWHCTIVSYEVSDRIRHPKESDDSQSYCFGSAITDPLAIATNDNANKITNTIFTIETSFFMILFLSCVDYRELNPRK